MEQLRTLRWPLVAVSLLVTLGALFAGGWAVRATTEDGPLGAFLAAQPAVSGHRLEHTGAVRRITVTLKDVHDLGQAYRDLDGGIRKLLGSAPYELAVTDRRTPALAEAFYRINPLVQEALATGRYAGVVEQVEARAAALGVTRARVSIDAGRVYVQLHAGADYLYEILPRPDAPNPARVEPTGGWNIG